LTNCDKLNEEFSIIRGFKNIEKYKEYHFFCLTLNEKLREIQFKIKNLQERELLLGLPTENYENISEVASKSQCFINFWTISSEFYNESLDLTQLNIMKYNFKQIETKMTNISVFVSRL
jgi:hypothetical protein